MFQVPFLIDQLNNMPKQNHKAQDIFNTKNYVINFQIKIMRLKQIPGNMNKKIKSE